jgi:tRNA modification GTPase
MNAYQKDTIAAVSTPPGEGGIAVIRISGKDALAILQAVFYTKKSVSEIQNHRAVTGWISDGAESVDEVIVTYFQHPQSYTGEDVVEISCHGSMYISRRILELFFRKGARPAQPGEFTLRAFLNGKMDLAQAEAVADLVHAKTEASRKAALNHLEGHLSKQIQSLREKLIHVCSLLEIEMDFSEEDINFTSRKELGTLLEKIHYEIEALINSFERGRICREGIRIVLVGKPNVGKSSILNCLLEKERAIVTEIPGTTRDTVEDVLDIGGVLTFITDTAGIWATSDPIEKEGVRRAQLAIEQADLVLLVFDGSAPTNQDDEALISKVQQTGEKILFIVNKTDLPSAWESDKLSRRFPKVPVFEISALKKTGVLKLVKTLEENIVSGEIQPKGEVLLTNVRHKDCLVKAKTGIIKAEASLRSRMSQEFIVMDLRGALDHLGEITGQTAGEEILKHIFSSFCIGK